jgi:hypothetical protein
MADTEVKPSIFSRLFTVANGVGLVGVLAYFFINALTRIHGNTGDFPAFYNAARAMLDGTNIYQTGFPDYIYPPLLAFLYTPFAWFPVPTAAAIALCFLLIVFTAALGVGSRAMAERFDVAPGWSGLLPVMCLAAVLSEDKLRGEFQMWQTNSLLLLSFSLALYWLDRRPTWAGLALAFAFNIKYLPILFLPYLLLRRRWAVAAAFVAGIPVFALLPAVLLGWDLNLEYLATAYRGLFRLVGLDIGVTAAAVIDPDLRSVISLSVTSGIARYLGPATPNRVTYAIVAGLMAVVGAWTWGQYRRAGMPFLYRADGAGPGDSATRRVVALEWAALLLLLLILSPQSNSRHYSMLVLANCLAVVALLHGGRSAPRWPVAAGAIALFLGSILPTGYIRTSLARQAWVEVGGISWCALLMLMSLVWFVLQDLRARVATPNATPQSSGSVPDPAVLLREAA